jgi:hypothetical protein
MIDICDDLYVFMSKNWLSSDSLFLLRIIIFQSSHIFHYNLEFLTFLAFNKLVFKVFTIYYLFKLINNK